MLGKKNKYTLRYLFIILLIGFTSIGKSQEKSLPDNAYEDSIVVKTHSAHKAAMYSALIPGLGQVYNKKYWKLPVIYGLSGVFIYAFDFNNDQYNKYKTAYAKMRSGEITEFERIKDENVLLRAKDGYMRDRDLNVIVLAAIYLLNIVDATVDAHLFDFDMSEDLSLNLQPDVRKTMEYNYSYGLCLRVNF